MKSVYNALKEPVACYLKKDIFRGGVKAAGTLAQKIKALEIEDKVSTSLNKELCEPQMLSYKSFVEQQKISNNFNYINPSRSEIKKVGLSDVLYRQFSSIEAVKMNNSVPRIHTGGDFAKVVRESSIFVDKSLFVKDIIEDKSEAILITMPRRWGKSLNLDMLRRFLSIGMNREGEKIEKEQSENYKLFAGGKIEIQDGFKKIEKEIPPAKLVVENEEALNLQGQYPVIFIDFKDCKGSSVEEVKSNLNKKITDTIENFGYLEVSNRTFSGFTTIGQKYREILNKATNGTFKEAIKDLSSLLSSYHDKKVWILIDEYDAAANKAYLEFSSKDAEVVSELFRGVFESALKANINLEKGVLTGVQYVVKSGMLSGLNNLSKYNVTSTKYSKYYGINQEEMEMLLKHFKVDETSSLKIKGWYNGYKSNNGSVENPNFIDKYNIWSVVNYLNNQPEGFKSYWENSSLGAVIDKEILQNTAIKNIVESLVNDNNLILGKLTTDFSVSDFETLKSIVNNHNRIEIKQDGIDLLFSYLFITGYLTNTSVTNQYALPNREIKTAFEGKLKDYYSQVFSISPKKFNDLTQHLESIFFQQDNKKISTIFTESFGPGLKTLIDELKVYSSKGEKLAASGVFGNEDLMHSLLNNIAIQVVNAKFSTERYTTQPSGSKGRSDIVLSKKGKGIVIEMKYDENAREALKQAKSYVKLVEDTNLKIFVGCNISKEKEVSLSGEITDSESIIEFNYTSIDK